MNTALPQYITNSIITWLTVEEPSLSVHWMLSAVFCAIGSDTVWGPGSENALTVWSYDQWANKFLCSVFHFIFIWKVDKPVLHTYLALIVLLKLSRFDVLCVFFKTKINMQDKMTEINPDLELRFSCCMPILHREVLCKSLPKHPAPCCWCCNYTVTLSGHERPITGTLLHFRFLTGTYCVSSVQVRTFHAHGDVLIRCRFSLDLKISQWWSLTNPDTDPLLLNPTLMCSFKSQTDRISLHGQEKKERKNSRWRN